MPAMKIPKRLQPLIEDGLIDGVVRQLMSGKEAMVFVVRCGDEMRCAKVYKEANKRSFRQAVDYTESRKTKNSRQARAMAKGTRYGRKAQEEAWQSAEVDALVPPRRRRRARAQALQLPRRRAADGAGDRRATATRRRGSTTSSSRRKRRAPSTSA